MKNIYRQIENRFEKFVSIGISFLGNSITFICAFLLVIFWFINGLFYNQDVHECIGNIILGVAFLSLFIIQKSFNRFSASLHLKVNELVASHDSASNRVMNTDEKTEHELSELSKIYIKLAEEVIEQDTDAVKP